MEKSEIENIKLRAILRDLFDAAERVVMVMRFLLYFGSVASAWFYMHDKVLAVAIVVSLTMAHLLIELMDFIREKKEEVTRS